jgi:hypothetical protein
VRLSLTRNHRWVVSDVAEEVGMGELGKDVPPIPDRAPAGTGSSDGKDPDAGRAADRAVISTRWGCEYGDTVRSGGQRGIRRSQRGGNGRIVAPVRSGDAG